MKTIKEFLEQDESGVYSEQDILKAMTGFADEFAIDFADFLWKTRFEQNDIFYKTTKQLLEIYKKQPE